MLLSLVFIIKTFFAFELSNSSSYDLIVGSYTKEGNRRLEVFSITNSAASKQSAETNISPDGKRLLTSNRVSSSLNGTIKDLKRDISVKMPAYILFNPSITDSTPEDRLKKLNIELIKPTAPIANYVKAVQTGNLIYLSGHGPDKPEGGQITGKVGKELSIEEGQAAARLTGISLISTLKAYIVDLSRVKRIVKVLGLVNCEGDFTQQPAVMNGFSNLMVDVFGEKGKHARSAVGAVALPNNIAVEIEMIVELKK